VIDWWLLLQAQHPLAILLILGLLIGLKINWG